MALVDKSLQGKKENQYILNISFSEIQTYSLSKRIDKIALEKIPLKYRFRKNTITQCCDYLHVNVSTGYLAISRL